MNLDYMTTGPDNFRIDISVIIPMFNAANYIENTIGSILNQKVHNQNIEVIIVDDVSSDNSCEIVKGIGNEKIKLITLEKNKGTANARNVGLSLAKGEWIQFVDSDDAICNDLYSKFEMTKKSGYNCYLFSLIKECSDCTWKQTITEVRDKRAFAHFGGVWNKFIKKDICVSFKEEFSFEDNVFIFDMMTEQELKMELIEDAYYIYNNKNEQSKMANFNVGEYVKMFLYGYGKIDQADRLTRMYILELFFSTIFNKDLPLSVSVKMAVKTLIRLLKYMPATAISQNRHFLKIVKY